MEQCNENIKNTNHRYDWYIRKLGRLQESFKDHKSEMLNYDELNERFLILARDICSDAIQANLKKNNLEIDWSKKPKTVIRENGRFEVQYNTKLKEKYND